MKKKTIFYILFAFFIMFGLKTNVQAKTYPELNCFYQNDKEGSDTIYKFHQDSDGKWTGFIAQKDGMPDVETSAMDIGVKKQQTCPTRLEYKVWPPSWTKNRQSWEIDQKGVPDAIYNLIEVNDRVCSYQEEGSMNIYQLVQKSDSSSIWLLELYQVKSGAEDHINKLEASTGRLHIAIMKGTIGKDGADDCPKGIYKINSGDYFTQYDNNYDPSKDIKYNLLDSNSTSYLQEGTSNAKAKYCVYRSGSIEYLLRQENDFSVKFYKLSTNKMEDMTNSFVLHSDGERIVNGQIVSCPYEIYVNSDTKYTNDSTKAVASYAKVNSAVCGTSTNISWRGEPQHLYIKTDKNYYSYSNGNAQVTYGDTLSKFSDFSIVGKINDSNIYKYVNEVCGEVKIGSHNSWTTFVIQTPETSENLNGDQKELSCIYDKYYDNGKFTITVDLQNKKISKIIPGENHELCDSFEEGTLEKNGIAYNDIIVNNSFNTQLGLKVQVLTGRICRIVRSTDSDSAKCNSTDTINRIEGSTSASYSALVVGDGGTKYNDRTYETYIPVCGIFKPKDAGGKLLPIIQNLYKILKIAIPLLVAVLTIIEFFKVLFSGEDKTMKDAFQATVKRFILIIVIIFLPILIEFIIRIAGLSENCLQEFL